MLKEFKKRSLPLTILVLVILLAGLLLPARVAQAINTPWLHTSGRFIQDPNGNNVVLRGVSLVDVSVADSRTRNARQQIDMATDEASGWYARVVRLPVHPEAIDGQPAWNAGPDAYFNNHLNPAVQECVARQIYCIIDWHYISDYTSSAIDTSTRNFWSYVAPKYANTPNVIFELFNEPVNPDNWDTWKATAQPWVNLIRSYAPNNLILIGGPRWSQNLSSAASSPFTGSNLVYVAHIYPEHGGQSTWDSWFGNAANSAPFFVTEWGWQQGGSTPTNGTQSGYGVSFSNYLESKGLSWTAWVFDMYWQPVMFDTNWNLLGGEAYEGQFVQNLLYQHQNVLAATWCYIEQPPGVLEIGYGSGTDCPQIAALHLSSGYLRLTDGTGGPFGTSIVLMPSFWSGGQYYQGAPVTYTAQVLDPDVDNPDLVLSITGNIAGLNVASKLQLSPPLSGSLVGHVTTTVNGNVALDNRPGEAFKPVMLSSMHISPTQWDSWAAYTDRTSSLPADAWIIQPPAIVQGFGLQGGSSNWKDNAPTVLVALDQPLQVTGWVTKSTDPNDDNVALWAASDQVLHAWSYWIAATSAVSGETPTALGALDKPVVHTGEKIHYQAIMMPGTNPTLADTYRGSLLPDGATFLSLVSTGSGVAESLGPSPVPFMANRSIVPDIIVFPHTFTGAEPTGTYFAYSGCAIPGSNPPSPVAPLCLGIQSFQFVP